MIGLALSGGGSRAMAFHLGCLRALDDLGLLNQINVLSTISGGSVVGAYFAYTPQKSFTAFEADVRRFLKEGFHRSIALEFARPKNFLSCITNFAATKIDETVSRLRRTEPKLQRFPSRTDMFRQVLERDVFTGLKMKSPRRGDISIVVGACELRTGSAFRFGNDKSGCWRHGEMVEPNVDVAFAAAASAAYPIFLPAFDRTWMFQKNGKTQERRVLITDGGVYDNLGIEVLEPGRNLNFNLHAFNCEYIISCNAGHGQESGSVLPMGFLPRVARSFEIVHRRVQDSAMHRLHSLKEARLIKGFVLPYLGQQDNRLAWKPTNLIPREEVITYPTNFAAMSEEWIEKLSGRGEQLTRTLISQYLPDLM
jgi:NTE family protein